MCIRDRYNSSEICGAYGVSKISKGSRISFLWHFKSESSFTQTIKALTAVLKEKRSVSSSIFLMVLFSVFNSASFAFSSVHILPFISSKNNLHNFFQETMHTFNSFGIPGFALFY